MDKEQLGRAVLGVLGRLLLADLAEVPHVEALVRATGRQDGLFMRGPLDLCGRRVEVNFNLVS